MFSRLKARSLTSKAPPEIRTGRRNFLMGAAAAGVGMFLAPLVPVLPGPSVKTVHASHVCRYPLVPCYDCQTNICTIVISLGCTTRSSCGGSCPACTSGPDRRKRRWVFAKNRDINSSNPNLCLCCTTCTSYIFYVCDECDHCRELNC